MRILLDQDGVLADLHHGWLHLHNSDHPGDFLHPGQVTKWAIHEFVKIGHRIYDYLKHPNLYDHVPVIPGAQEGVAQLIAAGHEVALVTDAGNIGPMIEGKTRWLGHNFPMLDPELYVFTKSKWLLQGDLMVDDGPHNLEKFNGLQLMFDAPHNHSETRFIRVYNWAEALAFCKKAGIL